MDHRPSYSFDPVVTRDQNRNENSPASALVGIIQGSACGVVAGDSYINHQSDRLPGGAFNKTNGQGRKQASENISFSNISEVALKKEGGFSKGDGKFGLCGSGKILERNGDLKEDVVKENYKGLRNSSIGIPSGSSSTADETSLQETSSQFLRFSPPASDISPISSAVTHCAANSTTSTTSSLPTLNLNLNLPPVVETVTHGFGVKMVASSSSQQLIYRSVPPRPLSYTLTDELDSRSANGPKHRSKTAPVSSNSPEEYAQRFKSRPTTRPKVIDFDGSAVSSKTQRSLMTPGFPSARAKIYIGHPKSKCPLESIEAPPSTARSPGSRLTLQPLGNGNSQNHSLGRSTTTPAPLTPWSQRSEKGLLGVSAHGNSTNFNPSRTLTKSATSSILGHTNKSTTSTLKPSEHFKEPAPSVDLTTSIPQDLLLDPEDHIHNPDLWLTSSTDCDDLSVLPRPKKVLPKRELPWVFRYKVKRGMNTLSKIMASKPSQNVIHANHAFT